MSSAVAAKSSAVGLVQSLEAGGTRRCPAAGGGGAGSLAGFFFCCCFFGEEDEGVKSAGLDQLVLVIFLLLPPFSKASRPAMRPNEALSLLLFSLKQTVECRNDRRCERSMKGWWSMRRRATVMDRGPLLHNSKTRWPLIAAVETKDKK